MMTKKLRMNRGVVVGGGDRGRYEQKSSLKLDARSQTLRRRQLAFVVVLASSSSIDAR